MAEMRLIDANKLKPVHIDYYGEAVDWNTIECAEEIDSETLPIVRELRKKLERVTAELDVAVDRIKHYAGCWECDMRDKGKCAMPFYKNECDQWEWRGPKKEDANE